MLEELYENGIKNAVSDLKIIDEGKIMELEPHVNENVVKAMHCKKAGVTSPYELVIALAENTVSNGVHLKLNNKVIGIIKEINSFIIKTNQEDYESKYIINCAGAFSDEIASFVCADNFKIYPRRGEYVLLNKNQGYLANHVLFQAPTKNIICRCEKVTEEEIVDALNRGIDISSLDAVKRRTRAGMGSCQGNFCGKRVAKLIARERNMKIEDVTLRGNGSSILPHREARDFYK